VPSLANDARDNFDFRRERAANRFLGNTEKIVGD
jgi:hypothetical protein